MSNEKTSNKDSFLKKSRPQGSQVKKNSSSSNGNNDSNKNVALLEKQNTKIPTEADLKRYENYVGEEWTGVCKWFNVSKGFGFVVPDKIEAKEDDVFVHQVVLSK